jgi:hypothetical protein
MVSGRRTHPAAPLAAAQLTALAGRLTGRDRQLCRLLADHQVLTTGLLALLLDAPPRTLQQRLTTLKVVDRSRPTSPSAQPAPLPLPPGEGAPWSRPSIQAPPWTGQAGIGPQPGGVAHANGRLTHLLGVNTVFVQLTHTAAISPTRGWCAGGPPLAARPGGVG